MTRTAHTGFLPSVVDGWNARDAQDTIKPTEALVLDNFFPSESYVQLRRGHASHATGIGGDVETLMPYESGGTSVLLAAGNGSIFDASTAGAVGTAKATGLGEDKWQYVQFKQFLIAVNGTDTPSKFDGSTWSTTTFTGSGLTATDLINVGMFKSRLFLVEKNTQSFWYPAVNNISGATTEFDLSPLAPNGGDLLAVGTWSVDSGSGHDDLCVFVMGGGDVIIYQGTDPGDASAWSLVGVYRVADPIGYRCLLNLGSDLIIITEDGYVPISRIIGEGDRSGAAITDKIRSAVVAAARSQSATWGWQAVYYPRGSMALFNYPTSTGTYQQHVLNTNTGAWCRFRGMNALCWATHDGDLYFGGTGGVVYQADTGTDDAGTDIDGDLKTGFHSFGQPVLKRFTMIRPEVAAEGALPLAVDFSVDFKEVPTPYTPSTSTSSGSPWNTSPWNTSPWTQSTSMAETWHTAGKIGGNASVRVRTQTRYQSVWYHGCRFMFERTKGQGF